MSRTLLLSLLILVSGPVAADSDPDPTAALAAIGDLGRLNGQALACRQTASASQAKTLMIRHAPKTRRYGEVFEERTSEAFLAQGRDVAACPSAEVLRGRLDDLSLRLQSLLPVGQPAAR
ncbi:MAG TPA: hypothetical protein PK440_19560 [Candidatus Accumulibacter phosphatis]|nr:hypothetical protein [Accumulibacter sp.]HCN69279.1 hypothetical protein [Accumulibacter sp.]HCV13686.1 hypothetical protein [Accumulibacter sp.]HRL74891.1 hypothetical protein [Candidatus Accumulibacter phosphatis]HRQ97162.1 hypothetical protein [Candidatus Accumulibacter phosphatis]